MKKIIIWALSLFFVILAGCTAQNVQPTAPVCNYYITRTDNSQHISGENNKVKADNKTQAKGIADIKTQANAEAEATAKSGMWIFATIALFATVAGLWFLWKKWLSRV